MARAPAAAQHINAAAPSHFTAIPRTFDLLIRVVLLGHIMNPPDFVEKSWAQSIETGQHGLNAGNTPRA
jgi:hypothetical protein